MRTTRPCLFGAEFPAGRATLLLNLGSPNSPSVPDVRDYLRTFLMDRRIIGISYPLRYFLVHHLVVPRRAPKSAAHYRTIWDADAQNFPLISHSTSIAQQLAELRREPVAVGMRYGHPGTGEALEALAALPDIEEVVIVPLYPHYARSSYETAVAFALEEIRRLGLRPMRLRLQAHSTGRRPTVRP